MDGFTFRVRMKFSDSRRLPIEESEYLIHEDLETVVWLVTAEAIADAAWVSLMGSSYPSEEEAAEAGDRWRASLSRSLAVLSIGADFGDRASKGGGMSEEFRQHLIKETGVPVYDDRHGVMTFPDTDFALFAKVEATGVARPSHEVLARALTSGLPRPLDDQELVAFDLFSASQFVAHIPDARFVMLVSAMEALIEPESRSEEGLALLRNCEEMARAAEAVGDEERKSLLDILGNMRRESIGRAGQRLMEPYADRLYGGVSAPIFFRDCYRMRSALVHGSAKRPDEQTIRVAGANLEVLVGHVIAGRQLVTEVLGAAPVA